MIHFILIAIRILVPRTQEMWITSKTTNKGECIIIIIIIIIIKRRSGINPIPPTVIDRD